MPVPCERDPRSLGSGPAPLPTPALPELPAHLARHLREAPPGEARALALVDAAREVRDLTLRGALALGEAALEEALRADSPRIAVLALIGLGYVNVSLGQPVRALDAVTQAQTLVDERGVYELRAAVLNTRALTRIVTGHWAGAAQDLHSALETARDTAEPLDAGYALGNLAWLANTRGDAKGALHLLNLLEEHIHLQGGELQRLLPYLHENRAHAYVVLGRQARQLGRPEAQQQAARQGLMVLRAADAALQDMPNHTTQLLCAAHRSALQLLSGHLERAYEAALLSGELSRQVQQRLYTEPHICLAEALEARGDPEAALAEYGAALEIMRAQQRYSDSQLILQAISALHERQGDLGAALQASREALSDAQAALQHVNETALHHLHLDRELRQARADASSWQDRLRHAEVQARQDALTGVLNRRGLEEGLHTLRGAQGDVPGGWSLLATIFVDIDHFKSVNDRFSHAHGDRVLQVVAGLLSAKARPGTLLGRYGGEEFVLVAPIRAPGQAHALAEACRQAVEAHDWSALLPGMQLTTSVGYAVERPERLSAALRAADDHLYRAKRAGRNRVHPPA